MSSTSSIQIETIGNPVWALFERKERGIYETRDRLFEKLSACSTELSHVVSTFFDEKRRTSPSPLLGELMPWVLEDICDTDNSVTRHIAVGWLALYLYLILIDTDADTGADPNPDRVLAGMLLWTTGLTQFYELVANKCVQTKISSSIGHAIASQYSDIHDTSPNNDLEYKAHYASGKNYCLVALANVFEAAKGSRSNLAVPFIRDLLLPIQYLDDISDWREDLRAGSYTVLLSRALTVARQPSGKASLGYADDDMIALRSLVSSGALGSTVTEIERQLSQALVSGNIRNHSSNDVTPTASYFLDLYTTVSSVGREINTAEESLRLCAEKDVLAILDPVRRSIAKIAQTT